MGDPLGSRYRLGEPLGRGAVGQVYVGVDAEGREYACKLLHPELTDDPELVARFVGERSILVRLQHPNLVGVHDLVAEGGTVAIVMDLVRGGDLRRYLTEAGALLPTEVARLGAGVAAALDAVHAAGLLHLDVKPENILLDESAVPRRPRLTDFGIARLVSPSRSARRSFVPGTPFYIAPELAAGLPPTAAVDIYSLGIVLYELCCGVTPFVGESIYHTMRLHTDCAPGRPEGIPDRLWELISAMVAKDPGRRPTAGRVAELLTGMAPDFAQLPCALSLTRPPDPISLFTPPPGPGATPGPDIPVPVGGVVHKRRRLVVLLSAVVLLVAGVLVGLAFARSGSTSTSAPPPGRDTIGGTLQTTEITTAPPVPTVTPNLVGKTVAQAQDSVPDSIQLDTQDEIDTAVSDGTITAQDPKAGDPLNGTIHVTVARRPVTVYLDSLDPTTGGWGDNSDVAQLGGKTYPHAVQAQVDDCENEPESVEYDVSKEYRSLVATAGIADESTDSSLKISLQLFADGRQVATTTIPFGATYPVDVDLSGVLRLKIEWQVVGADSNCSGDNTLVLGTASLLGLPGEVPSDTASATPTN